MLVTMSEFHIQYPLTNQLNKGKTKFDNKIKENLIEH